MSVPPQSPGPAVPPGAGPPGRDRLFWLLKSVARQSAVYGIFDFMGKAGAFLLVPLYAQVLGPADYGMLEIFVITQALLLLLSVLGFNSALMRFYTLEDHPGARERYFLTALTTVAIFSGVVCLALALAAPVLSRVLFGSVEQAGFWRLVFLSVFLDAVAVMYMAFFRSREKPLLYSAVNMVKLFGVLGLNVVLVGVLHHGVKGALVGNCIGTLLGAGTGAVLAAGVYRPRIDRAQLRRLAGFGLPVCVGGVALFLMNSMDRYLLKGMVGLEDLGIYTFGYKVGMVMTILVNAFVVAWPPLMFRITREPNAPEIYSRVVTYYLFITGWVLVGIGSLRSEVIGILGGEAYRAADRVVLLILFSYLCHGLYYIFSVGVSTTDRTRLIPAVVGVGAAVNLVANLVLIPRYGILGAAWATAASFATIAVIMYRTGQRYVRIPAEKVRLLLLTLTVAGILVVNLRIIGEGGMGQTLARAALALSFPGILALAGFFDPEERRRARRLLLRR